MATMQMRTTARGDDGTGRHPAAGLDGRAAGRDALLFLPELHAAQSGHLLCWAGTTTITSSPNPAFASAVLNTIYLVGGVLLITVVGGLFLALLIDQPIFGQGIVRILVISPSSSCRRWRRCLEEHADETDLGIFAWLFSLVGLRRWISWSADPASLDHPDRCMAWLPFATLILLTALQSLDGEQMEAAVNGWRRRRQPLHLSRAAASVARHQRRRPHRDNLLLGVFAEILVTTNGGPGTASTKPALPRLHAALLNFDVGRRIRRRDIIAVVVANIVAFFLMRFIGKNLEA